MESARVKQGRFRHFGMLLQKGGTSPSGAPKTGFSTAATNVFASIEPLRAMASDDAGVERQRALYEIKIRPRAGFTVTKDMRFRQIRPGQEPVDYQIETIMPEMLGRYIALTCVRMEKAADLG
jgi:head-tail adaptor